MRINFENKAQINFLINAYSTLKENKKQEISRSEYASLIEDKVSSKFDDFLFYLSKATPFSYKRDVDVVCERSFDQIKQNSVDELDGISKEDLLQEIAKSLRGTCESQEMNRMSTIQRTIGQLIWRGDADLLDQYLKLFQDSPKSLKSALNFTSYDHNYFLSQAIDENDFDMVSTLVKHGAESKEGDLGLAAARCQKDIFELLLSERLKTQKPNHEDFNTFMYRAAGNHFRPVYQRTSMVSFINRLRYNYLNESYDDHCCGPIQHRTFSWSSSGIVKSVSGDE